MAGGFLQEGAHSLTKNNIIKSSQVPAFEETCQSHCPAWETTSLKDSMTAKRNVAMKTARETRARIFILVLALGAQLVNNM